MIDVLAAGMVYLLIAALGGFVWALLQDEGNRDE